MVNKILVPTDGSKNAQKAVEVAVNFVKNYGTPKTEVNVVYVFTGTGHSAAAPSGRLDPDQFEEYLKKETETFTQKAVQTFEEAGIEVNTISLGGDPGAEIVEFAEKEKFDMIIMGTRGKTGFSAWVPGSVAQKVVSRAPCPVMLVR